jgi:hypothetical protein
MQQLNRKSIIGLLLRHRSSPQLTKPLVPIPPFLFHLTPGQRAPHSITRTISQTAQPFKYLCYALRKLLGSAHRPPLPPEQYPAISPSPSRTPLRDPLCPQSPTNIATQITNPFHRLSENAGILRYYSRTLQNRAGDDSRPPQSQSRHQDGFRETHFQWRPCV